MKKVVALLALWAGGFSFGASFPVTVTAYNALSAQTDSTPTITATGTRVRTGIVALSRDLLRVAPYGSVVRFEQVRGENCGGFTTGNLRVEDTMAARKFQRADIFMWSKDAAINWGSCSARMVVVRRAAR
ncbi:3D domain-containing protein [Deinococcus kurensis]|uniref:3D domain-containing protein n=1 Tax=Deinococcus kurensis TaxID=2662757 RepID=UPI001F19C485|nr:3D domain-containing protein [Deinococcus kurensis]